MHALQLCDWTTIRGSNNTVTQGEDQWLDLAPFQECVFWIDVRELSPTGNISLNIQTSPCKDEVYFKNMFPTITAVAQPSPVANKALLDSAPVPLARWVRWQLSSTAAPWDITMRIWVSANSPGM